MLESPSEGRYQGCDRERKLCPFHSFVFITRDKEIDYSSCFTTDNLCGQNKQSRMLLRSFLLYFVSFSGFFPLCKLENVVPGHLQPLGSHRPAEGKITSIDYVPTAEVFFKEYVMTNQPVIFKGAAKLSSGFSLWTDSYIR